MLAPGGLVRPASCPGCRRAGEGCRRGPRLVAGGLGRTEAGAEPPGERAAPSRAELGGAAAELPRLRAEAGRRLAAREALARSEHASRRAPGSPGGRSGGAPRCSCSATRGTCAGRSAPAATLRPPSRAGGASSGGRRCRSSASWSGRGWSPACCSYSTGISACEKCGQWLPALSLFVELRHARLQHDVVSYSAGVSACEKGRQWRQALHLLSEIWEEMLEPDLQSAIALGSARARKGGRGSRRCRCSAACGGRCRWRATSSATTPG
ncbi:unnamed protein product [Prorocentrum cordatum]|uniref:Uncharacterized protein n=1 Tax=Prorocentrum cordatum TaxID=2364126 RepID=A0ABN9V1Z4_9DINO|nr:unnamed protein product [Polarella glacialis]